MRILIAEDNRIIIELIKSIVKPYGIPNITMDGEEALKKFKEKLKDSDGYDLVLLDIMMPKLSGIEVLEEIRKIEKGYDKKVKIIMQSALSDLESIQKSEKADGYLIKPYTKEIFLKELKILELI